jgi:FkbM family methyltransferase
MSLAKELRKFAERLDTPGAGDARRLRVPLNLYRCFERIKHDFAIRTVLDVGANRGEFARHAAGCFPGAAIHCFEPLPVCQPLLQALAAQHPQIRLHPFALGETSGNAEMFENDYAPSSSLLPMQERHRELWPKTVGTKKITVAIETLDGAIAREKPAAPFFLKLDVQGFEMSVLRGATEALRHTAVVMMEVLFEPLYAGQSDYRELLNFMAERDFRFVEFADERRLPPLGKLVYADAILVNGQFAAKQAQSVAGKQR